MPGGNTRTVIYTSPFPITIASGEVVTLWDVDGHCYTDFLGEYTAGLFGRTHPVIRAAVLRGLDRGLTLSGHNKDEAELARILTERFDSLELVRFTNSGTEANLMAITAALAFTKRNRIVVFEGAYHGSVLGYPAGGEIKGNAPYNALILPYNDLTTLADVFEKEGDTIAAVLVEPMMGSAGCVPASQEFLRKARSLTHKHGSLLIFDEVQTSRLAPGGLQGLYNIMPDLTTLGKYIAGGLSFGAFGGATSIMAQFDPRRADALRHAGTFNNNSISMSCGVAVMQQLFDKEACIRLNEKGDNLRERLNGLAKSQGLPMHVSGLGSIMNVHFVDQPINNARDARVTSPKLRELLWLEMLNAGFWIAPRGMMSLSLAHEDSDIDSLCEAMAEFLSNHADLIASNS